MRKWLLSLALLCLWFLPAPDMQCQGADSAAEFDPPVYLKQAGGVNRYPSSAESADASLGILEAVRVALATNPDLTLSRLDIYTNKGYLESAQGEFDFILDLSSGYNSSHAPTPNSQVTVVTPPDLRTDNTSLSMGLSRKFRTGLETTTSVAANHYRMAPLYYEPYATAKVEFGLTVPLLKGLGTEATGAGETAARKSVESSLWQSKHTAAETVRNVAQAYWSYLAALKEHAQAREALKRAEKLLKDTEELIKGGQQAEADIYQVKAQVSDKTLKIVQADQNIVTARHNLGLAMGLTSDSIENLPWPESEFPSLNHDDLLAAGPRLTSSPDLFLQKRADYLAAGLSEESLKILARQSRLNLKPQLDAFVKVGYAGVEEGHDQSRDMVDSFGDNVGGANAQVGLTYYFPVENRDARGKLVQALASLRKQEVTTKDLARTIKAKINQAYKQLLQGQEAVEQSLYLVETYKKTVEVEEWKSRLGESTILDVVTTQDRLYEAWMTLIQSQLDFANALIDFRFQTGTLISYSGETGTVELTQLMDLPRLGGG